jgi:hypothetical protein
MTFQREEQVIRVLGEMSPFSLSHEPFIRPCIRKIPRTTLQMAHLHRVLDSGIAGGRAHEMKNG